MNKLVIEVCRLLTVGGKHHGHSDIWHRRRGSAKKFFMVKFRQWHEGKTSAEIKVNGFRLRFSQ
jgi:hypothetical protein